MPGCRSLLWRGLLLTALVAQGLVCVCCGSGGNPVGTSGQDHKNVSEWVDDLRAAYRAEGIRGLDETRRRMIVNESLLREDPAYDTAAMLLGLGETAITAKESELTAELRTLAKYIEMHPGQSRDEYDRLRGKLFSYSFGNGPVEPDSVPAKLADLYSLIADGDGD